MWSWRARNPLSSTPHPGAVMSSVRGRPGAEEIPPRQYRLTRCCNVFVSPAGLLDIPRVRMVAAERELTEEAAADAGRWDTLAGSFYTSPGGSAELIRVNVARTSHPRATARAQDEETNHGTRGSH